MQSEIKNTLLEEASFIPLVGRDQKALRSLESFSVSRFQKSRPLSSRFRVSKMSLFGTVQSSGCPRHLPGEQRTRSLLTAGDLCSAVR